jgi:DNA-binding PadR family transcriptional regulator
MTGYAHPGRCGGPHIAPDPRGIDIWWFAGRGGRHGGPRRHRDPFGPGDFGRGPRARRGDVRAAAMLLLEEEPRNGYQLMQEIERRSNGLWRPSPGAMYPALAQLEDEGMVRAEEREGRKVFVLTDEGRAHVEERREHLGVPWEQLGGASGEIADLRGILGQIATALHQVARHGTREQSERARGILDDARRALYRLLADDEG